MLETLFPNFLPIFDQNFCQKPSDGFRLPERSG
jgi:hypothetical protein